MIRNLICADLVHAGRSFSPAVNILPWIYFADMVSLRVNKIDSVSPLRTGLALSPRKKPLRSKSTGSLGSHASGWDAVSLRFFSGRFKADLLSNIFYQACMKLGKYFEETKCREFNVQSESV